MDNVEIIQQWLVEKNQEGIVRNVYHDGKFSGPSYEEMATDLASRLNGTTSASLNTTAGAKSDYGAVEVSHTKPRRGALQHFYRLTEDGRQLCLDLFGPEPTS
jgi:hypothetical protein